MTRAHRIQLDPTEAQKRYFAQAAGTARFVYNWALAEWNEQYRMGGRPSAKELKRYFNSVKYLKFPWLRDMHRDSHGQPFSNLQAAWARHFESLKKLKRGEIKKSHIVERPRFKKKGKSRDCFYVANDKLSVDGRIVKLPVIGQVRLTEDLRFVGKIQSATVSREADRWFVSIAVDAVPEAVIAPTGGPVGVDLGIKTFATLSTGEKVAGPKALRRALRRLRRLGRAHSRKQIKSANRRKAAMKLAKQHRRIKNVRQDFLHKFTTRLARTHSEICIEDLNVRGMLQNQKLALHISDAAWAEARRQLEYKTVLYGSKLTVRDRFYPSSKLCSKCGAKNHLLRLSDREWFCDSCGALHDRDNNAANNLLNPIPLAKREITPLEIAALASGIAGSETAVSERGTLPCAHLCAQER